MVANLVIGTLLLLGVLHMLGDAHNLTISARRWIGTAFTLVWGVMAGIGSLVADAFLDVGMFFMLVSLAALVTVRLGLLARPPGEPREQK